MTLVSDDYQSAINDKQKKFRPWLSHDGRETVSVGLLYSSLLQLHLEAESPEGQTNGYRGIIVGKRRSVCS